MGHVPFWDERTIAKLKAAVAEGKSAGTIGTELGISRNSVIGKARRLGLALDGPRGKPPKPRDAEEAAKAKKATEKPSAPVAVRTVLPPITPTQSKRRGGARNLPVPIRPEPVKPAPAAPEPIRHDIGTAEGVPFLDLKPGQCRFAVTPFSATSHRFCAEAVQPGSSYCQGHHARCYDGTSFKTYRPMGSAAAFNVRSRRLEAAE